MIFTKSFAFGLDLSDLSIKIASLEQNGQSLSLASFGRLDLPQNLIESGVIKKEQELIEEIKKAVRQVQGERISSSSCIVSLPETEAYIRVVQLPKMKSEEIPEAIKWEIEANIPVALDDIYFDWQAVGNEMPNQTDILIGALPKVSVDPYLSVIKKAGLKPLAFEIESVAIARALIRENELSEPVIIVDLGARRTNLIIYCGRTVWFTTSLPISNISLTADVAKSLKISLEQAKEMKFAVGLDPEKQGSQVFEAMEPRLLELTSEIGKYIEYWRASSYSRRSGEGLIKKILLCGGGANLGGLPAFISGRLKVETVIGNPWVNIITPAAKEVPKIPFNESLSYATALGLALRGVKNL